MLSGFVMVMCLVRVFCIEWVLVGGMVGNFSGRFCDIFVVIVMLLLDVFIIRMCFLGSGLLLWNSLRVLYRVGLRSLSMPVSDAVLRG